MVAPEIADRGADSSDKGAKLPLTGHYNCEKSLKKSFSSSDRGLARSEGVIIPSRPPLVPSPCD